MFQCLRHFFEFRDHVLSSLLVCRVIVARFSEFIEKRLKVWW